FLSCSLFFFSSRRRHTRFSRDWSSDVCSSDLKNLFFIGIILYGCVLLGMHDLFELLPTANKLIPILPVLYILGGNVVLNMAMGFNTEIIAYSKHYRFNLTAIILLDVLNIGLNYYILTQTNYGIIGVAWAS